MFINLIVANLLALFCWRSLAKGKAHNASNPRISANQVTYSGCFGYSIQLAMEEEKRIISPDKKNELPKSESTPEV